jgi:hypothetical protein
MADDPTCPVIPLAKSAPEGLERLRAMPSRTNPAGETVQIQDCWDEVLQEDPQRAALVPVALAALDHAAEIWRFIAVEANGYQVEHQPHLIWCRPGENAEPETCLAGTRRIDGQLHLHTWFRLDDPWAALRRYWAHGTRQHPLRRVRPTYVPGRDVLYLHPDPSVPYRATKLAPSLSLFAYLDARVGYPALVGFEFQDTRQHVPLLEHTPEIAGLLTTRWGVGDNVETLASLLTATPSLA